MAYWLTVRGQVTFPKRIREHLGLENGGGVEFVLGKPGEVILRKVGLTSENARLKGRFAAVRGTATGTLSTDEILAMTRG